MYTSNAAYASFDENVKGSIKNGFLADFVVMDEDITKIDPVAIWNTTILGTVVGGNLTYNNGLQ